MDGTIADMDFENNLWLKEIPKLYAEKHKISIKEAKKVVFSEYRKVGDEDLRWYDVKYWLEHFELKKDFQQLVNDLKHHIKLYPESKDIIKGLSRKHKLIIISNAPRAFLDLKIEVESIKDYFDRIFSITSDFKMIKKGENVYKEICKILKIKPEELMHIGDHYKFDYQVPRKLNIKAYYLDRKGKRKGKYIVRSLKEFKERISQELS